MTSVVKVAAHCTEEKEVVVETYDVLTQEIKATVVLNNNESRELYIYDAQGVRTYERLKEK